MNDIQKDYLIGLLFKQVNSFDIETMKEANIDNENYLMYLRDFIEDYASDIDLMNQIFDFLKSENLEFITGPIMLEKDGLFVEVRFNDQSFKSLAET
ncbi:hypothetical protein [Mycoplasma sp. P36-A1]|uniref:hypothetical protein n=1 Tax=Mycoplasma sp. P36-A1 TaxID=3252900 RepID=UPI003C2E0653